nr:putative uncharacterized protein encoded by ZNF503-AS2 isoform X1 [Kogia breviceps]
MVVLGALGSLEPVCTRAGAGAGPGDPVSTRAQPALSPLGAEVGFGTCPRRARPLLSHHPIPLSLIFVSVSHSEQVPRTFWGIDIISLAAGCAVCIRINPARIRPAGNRSRFPCTETHRPSTGREMAPRAHKAAGLASEGGWTVSALRPSSLSLPGSAWQSPASACASGARRAESVRGEN